MLELDLARLDREGRLALEGAVSPDDPLWDGQELRLRKSLRVKGSAQRAGADVLVRLHVRGEVVIPCSRCLREVGRQVEDEVSLLFRAGVSAEEAETEGTYPLPERAGGVLDLGGPLREHVLLAVPRYAICREACRGLCAHCGADLNEGQCECRTDELDERWAALRRVRFD